MQHPTILLYLEKATTATSSELISYKLPREARRKRSTSVLNGPKKPLNPREGRSDLLYRDGEILTHAF